MSTPRFTIPAEYQNKLRYEPVQDTRSDAEILQQLQQHQPIVSEKNVWSFWHSGVNGMHPWLQRNVCSWVRMHPGWTVRVLSNVKTQAGYALNYVETDLLPETYVKGLMEDDISLLGPHSSDFLRTATLYQHGGVFIDVGIFLVRNLERICWSKLEDPSSPYQVAVPHMFGTTCANHFTASRKGDPFIQRFNILFKELWKGRNSGKGVTGHPLLLQHFQTKDSSIERMDRYNFDVKSQETYSQFADYVAQIFTFERLCRVVDDNGFNCMEYWNKHALVWDCRREDWPAEDQLGGFPQACPKFFEVLSTPLSASPESDEYKEAHKLTWYILANSFMQKIYRGATFLHDSLGARFDADTGGHDAKKGTFGEIFRWGCENLVQTREPEYHEAPTTIPITTGLLKAE